jgi:hypothetical protein
MNEEQVSGITNSIVNGWDRREASIGRRTLG